MFFVISIQAITLINCFAYVNLFVWHPVPHSCLHTMDQPFIISTCWWWIVMYQLKICVKWGGFPVNLTAGTTTRVRRYFGKVKRHGVKTLFSFWLAPRREASLSTIAGVRFSALLCHLFCFASNPRVMLVSLCLPALSIVWFLVDGLALVFWCSIETWSVLNKPVSLS